MWSLFHSIIGVNDPKIAKNDNILNMMKSVRSNYPHVGRIVTPNILSGMKYNVNQLTCSQYLAAIEILRRFKLYIKKRK